MPLGLSYIWAVPEKSRTGEVLYNIKVRAELRKQSTSTLIWHIIKFKKDRGKNILVKGDQEESFFPQNLPTLN